MIDAAGLVLLAVSGAISFALGRTVVHFRRKKRDRLAQEAQEAQAAQELALRNRPPEPPSKNKSKRKRQLQQEQQQVKPR